MPGVWSKGVALFGNWAASLWAGWAWAFRSGDESTGDMAISAQGYDRMTWRKGTLGAVVIVKLGGKAGTMEVTEDGVLAPPGRQGQSGVPSYSVICSAHNKWFDLEAVDRRSGDLRGCRTGGLLAWWPGKPE